jgi:fatty-acyl-CoA synthase
MSAPVLPTAANESAAKAWLRALEMTAHIEDAATRTLPRVIQELGTRFGDAPALIGTNEQLSHSELAARANRYARWGLRQGITKGDGVALMLPNCPDYLAAWVGLTGIGAVVALLNTNLRDAALVHAINAAAPRHMIVAPPFARAIEAAMAGQEQTPHIWNHDDVFLSLKDFSGAPLDDNLRTAVTLDDTALLIYTSGTTGYPKAARVSHRRVMNWTHWFAGMTGVTSDDRLYNCLPMYHSVGGVVACGAALVGGGAVIVREKFSARGFWPDVAESGATVFQYIGELCRYLLTGADNAPAHKLRLAVGNGLTGDVWEAFQARFAIPRILEFYAATEGNFSLYNAEGKPGAIGRIPPFLRHRFAAANVAFDEETQAPARGPDGLGVPGGRGQAGEAIGRIGRGNSGFEGYTDTRTSETKILRDVFKSGDAWVRTGDLMRQDGQGFFYFVDRIGDTFRWKGENVATTEVAAVAAGAPGVTAACVYGVAVPGQSGKCGMAALEVTKKFDAAAFAAHCATRLPAYARPLFLRLVENLAVTETFKQKKHELAKSGYDPSQTNDILLVDTGNGYVPLSKDLYARIKTGLIRL